MKYVNFSLRMLLLVITVLGISFYWVIPFQTTILCDYKRKLNDDGPVDVQGRNKNESFRTLIRNVRPIAIETIGDPNRGQLKVTFRTSLHRKSKLRHYEILCIVEAE